MTTVALPGWNSAGLLPPMDEVRPVWPDRSPYPVSLTECVTRLGSSSVRRSILDGLMRYRNRLHRLGLVDGFQWLDGSFMEDVKRRERRDPRDVDVVTFYRLPPGRSQADFFAADPSLFVDRPGIRSSFFVDGYFENLATNTRRLVERAAYWYSVWSHSRDFTWKGFVQIDLSPQEDATAVATLAGMSTGGQP